MKALIIGNDLKELMAYTDSTIGRDAMPLFVPDGEDWCVEIGLAFRIGRLGKNIKEKFAQRYIDGLSAVVRMYQVENKGKAWNCIMDNALTPGQFVQWAERDIELVCNDTTISYKCEDLISLASQAISNITKISTIKTGDLIIPASSFKHQLPLSRDNLIRIGLNGEPVMKLKIK